MATTCRRRRPKLISISGCVSLLAIEQGTPGVRELLNARNLLIPASIHPGSSSLPLQSSAGNGFKKIDFDTGIAERLI
jgi:hypothetical protein